MDEQLKCKSDDKISKDTNNDLINSHHLIEFLEYEEAVTTDKGTATRIRVLLINLGIWDSKI